MIGKSLVYLVFGARFKESIQARAGVPIRAADRPRPHRLASFAAAGLDHVTGSLQTLRSHWQPQPVRWWRELAALGLFMLGLSWSVPWFRALSAATRTIPYAGTALVFTVIGVGAYTLVRIMLGFRISAALRRNTLMAFMLGAAAYGLKSILYAKEVIPLTELVVRPLWALANFTNLVPNEVLVIGAVLLVLRQGAVLAQDYVGPTRVMESFKVGIGMFIFFSLVITTVTGEMVPEPFLLLFLVSGLTAMGAARMDSIGALRGGGKARFEWGRLLAMLAGVCLTALAAYQAGLAFSRDGGALTGVVLGLFVLSAFVASVPLLLAFLYLLYAAVSMYREQVSALFEAVLDAIQALWEFLSQVDVWIRNMGAVLAEKFEFLAPVFRVLIGLAPGIRLLVLAAAIVIPVLLVFAALWIRARRQRGGEISEEHESIGLNDWLRLLRLGMQARLKERPASLSDYLAGRRRKALAARIRRLFLNLIELGAKLGHPMGPAQTPDEFSEAFATLLPAEKAAIFEMTRAYERIRYGELPEDAAEVRRVQKAWTRVRQAAAARRPGLR